MLTFIILCISIIFIIYRINKKKAQEKARIIKQQEYLEQQQVEEDTINIKQQKYIYSVQLKYLYNNFEYNITHTHMIN